MDVYNPGGAMIARVRTPEPVANAAFGGPGGAHLLVCSSTSVFLLETKTAGRIRRGPSTISSKGILYKSEEDPTQWTQIDIAALV